MLIRTHLQRLVERARLLPPLAAAIVHPCDRDSLQLALSGQFASYLAPTLVGPEQRIRDVANRAGLDISRLPIVDTPDEPRAASERAVQLARAGEVAALVKGALTDGELLGPVAAPDSGLRTGSRLSYAHFLDLPGQPRAFLLADAHLNVTPNLAAKRDIVHNTVLYATALGLAAPNVALLAAVDAPSSAFGSTTDAVALKSMAQGGTFGGAVVDGPLTPDCAIAPEAARRHGVKSTIAGRADVLIAPTMESAVMVLRTCVGLTEGLAAGLVLGARVPIVAPDRHESMEVRMASCVLALLVSSASRETAPREAPAAANSIAREVAARVAA